MVAARIDSPRPGRFDRSGPAAPPPPLVRLVALASSATDRRTRRLAFSASALSALLVAAALVWHGAAADFVDTAPADGDREHHRSGVYDGAVKTVASPGTCNDGDWHLMTATLSPGTGLRLADQ